MDDSLTRSIISAFKKNLCSESDPIGLEKTFFEINSDLEEIGNETIDFPFSLTRAKMLYESHYWNEVCPNVKLFEYIVSDGQNQRCCWRVLIGSSNGDVLIGTKELPIYQPTFSKHSSKGFKRAVSATIFSALKDMQIDGSISSLTFTSIFPDTDELTDWQINIHKTGAECLVKYDIYVDLSQSQEELWSALRKSYKPLINRSKKLWTIEIIDQPEVEKLIDFRVLHASEAGRITRSESTWRSQLEMIRQGNAFMIQTRTTDSELIGCAFLAHSNYEAIYFSGAYRRDMFDLPIAHVIQWNAICELKRRGIKWYNLGEYYFAKGNDFSQKEENISFFKSGFSTNLHRRYIYR